MEITLIGKKVYHKLLGEGILTEVSGENAMVYFIKKVPVLQVFPSKDAMLGDWKNETLDFIDKYKNRIK